MTQQQMDGKRTRWWWRQSESRVWMFTKWRQIGYEPTGQLMSFRSCLSAAAAAAAAAQSTSSARSAREACRHFLLNRRIKARRLTSFALLAAFVCCSASGFIGLQGMRGNKPPIPRDKLPKSFVDVMLSSDNYQTRPFANLTGGKRLPLEEVERRAEKRAYLNALEAEKKRKAERKAAKKERKAAKKERKAAKKERKSRKGQLTNRCSLLLCAAAVS